MAPTTPNQAPDDKGQTKAGFIAILGAPNAGKSTLVNKLTGAKVSIVTPKAQTTRNRILGIFQHQETQVILVDTPGIFAPKKRLDRAMVAAAWGGAMDADLLALMIDVRTSFSLTKGLNENCQQLINDAKNRAGKRKIIPILNKIDLIPRETLLALTDALQKLGPFDDILMVSAKTGDGLDDVKALFAKALPQGPWLFPEDQISDMPERLLAAEITREKLFLRLNQELPYAISVETQTWETRKDGSVLIHQAIFVEREGQRKILLGKDGSMIKAIGTSARHELAKLLDCNVHLKLFVKVRPNWQDDSSHYRPWGLDFNSK